GRAQRAQGRSLCGRPCRAPRRASLSWPGSAASLPTPRRRLRAGRESKPHSFWMMALALKLDASVLEAQPGPAGDLDAGILVVRARAPLVELHHAGRQQFQAVEELGDLGLVPVGLR